MKTYIYYNLHKSIWSLMVGGKVVGHEKSVVVTNVEFRVRPGGHKRVLEQKRKNVHAFVIGKIPEFGVVLSSEAKLRQVKYNPYKADHFYFADTNEKAERARLVEMRADRTVWALC
jgi:hypothetical protein